MRLKIHDQDGNTIAELQSGDIVISTVQDALDLMADAGYLGARKIIMKKEHLCSEFFDLKTGVAGEIVQKFSTYNIQLAVVGDFSVFSSKSLKDFILESNRIGKIVFVATTDEAIKKLSKKRSHQN